MGLKEELESIWLPVSIWGGVIWWTILHIFNSRNMSIMQMVILAYCVIGSIYYVCNVAPTIRDIE